MGERHGKRQAGPSEFHPPVLPAVRRWLHHFNGVATRYLDNYLSWCWAIDLRRIGNAERFLAAALGHFGG
jgi:hypothetical protein